jgi:hypothetical protein
MTKPFYVIVCLAYMLFSPPQLMAQEMGERDLMFVDENVTRATNVHYTGKFCSECHDSTPEEGGEQFLKFEGEFSSLCRCHGYTSENYIHPVNIIPTEKKKGKIPDNLPLENGKVTCSTCHDIYKQCQSDRRMKSRNKFFLRGAPYAKRTDLCFRCHDEAKYKMLDPHNQLDENGEIIEEKCLYCHAERPDEKRATFKRTVGVHGSEVKLIGDLEVLCYRCHYKQSTLHPIRADHFREPSTKTLEIMKESEKTLGIILPLNYEGEITCVTCHNPHERGVIPSERAASEGASEKFRLRLHGEPGEICVACHKDKIGAEIGTAK